MRKVTLLVLPLVLALQPAACQEGVSSSDMTPLSMLTRAESESQPIFLTKRVAANLSHLYSSQDKEIPLCVFGQKEQDRYVVDQVRFPLINASSDSRTQFNGGRCRKHDDFLGYVHNHDYISHSGCHPSVIDIRRLLLDEDSELEVIACKDDSDVSFHAYHQQEFSSDKQGE
jgi:hypothetical protein